MTAAEFKAALQFLWGDTWRQRAPTEFDTTSSTIDRWANGHAAVPGPAGRLVEKLLADEKARVTQRGYERAYQKRRRANRLGHGLYDE